jgi:HEAT repeat protein
MSSLASLLSDDWRRRRQAVESLLQRDDAGLALELVDAVRQRHTEINLLNAALRILEGHHRAPLAELVALMEDPDPEVRMYVPLVLGELADARSLPALIAALQDPVENVRFNAVEALGKLRRPEAVDPLLDVLRADTPFVRYAVALALAAIGDPRPVGALLPLLADPGLAEPVALALGQLAAPEAAGEIAAWAERGQGEIWVAVEALSALEQRFPTSADLRVAFLDAAGPRLRRQLVEATRVLMREDLTESLDPRPAQAALVLGWLYQSGVDDADLRQVLVRLLAVPVARQRVEATLFTGPRPLPAELLAAVKAPEREWAHSAARVLALDPGPNAAEPLLEALRSDDETLATIAAEGLGRLSDPRAVEPLLARIGAPAAQLRRAIVEALARIDPPGLEDHLRRLAASPIPDEREAAIQLLCRSKSSQYNLPLVLAALGDPAPAVRVAAIEALPGFEDPQILSALSAAMADPDPNMRAAAARALAGLPPEQALIPLHAALADADAWVRLYACRSLGCLGQSESAGPLTQALSDPLPPVRIAAAQALARLSPVDFAARLDPLREDPTPEVRQTVRQVLDQAGPTSEGC